MGDRFSGRQPFQYVGTRSSRGGRAPFYFRPPGSEWWNSSVGSSNPRPVRHRRVLPGMTSFPGAARPPAGLPASCRYGSWRRSDSLHPRTACPSVATSGVLAQKVKVEPEVVAYPGQTVILHCQFLDKGQTQLTQVSWILENSSGTRTVIAVFHPTFGVIYPASPVQGRVSFTLETPSLENPTIQITDIALTDVGNYICEYATYPTGNEKGVTSLILLD